VRKTWLQLQSENEPTQKVGLTEGFVDLCKSRAAEKEGTIHVQCGAAGYSAEVDMSSVRNTVHRVEPRAVG
jgi:hypothetical protein